MKKVRSTCTGESAPSGTSVTFVAMKLVFASRSRSEVATHLQGVARSTRLRALCKVQHRQLSHHAPARIDSAAAQQIVSRTVTSVQHPFASIGSRARRCSAVRVVNGTRPMARSPEPYRALFGRTPLGHRRSNGAGPASTKHGDTLWMPCSGYWTCNCVLRRSGGEREAGSSPGRVELYTCNA